MLRDSHVHNYPRHSAAYSPPTPANQVRSRALRGTSSLAHLMVTQGYVSVTTTHPTVCQHTSIAHPDLATISNLRSSSASSNLYADVTACLREPRKLLVSKLRHRGHDGHTQVPGPTIPATQLWYDRFKSRCSVIGSLCKRRPLSSRNLPSAYR